LRTSGSRLFGDAAALRELGARYLAEHPQERDRSRLVRLLGEDRRFSIRSALIERIARDWRAHDVTAAGGWVLARTEARLCALLHLMDSGAA
jgi:hypothetical protein